MTYEVYKRTFYKRTTFFSKDEVAERNVILNIYVLGKVEHGVLYLRRNFYVVVLFMLRYTGR